MTVKAKKIWELDDYHGKMPSENDLIPAIDVNGDADPATDYNFDPENPEAYDKAVTRKLNFGQIKTQMMQMAAKWISLLGKSSADSLLGYDSETGTATGEGELAELINDLIKWLEDNALDVYSFLQLMESMRGRSAGSILPTRNSEGKANKSTRMTVAEYLAAHPIEARFNRKPGVTPEAENVTEPETETVAEAAAEPETTNEPTTETTTETTAETEPETRAVTEPQPETKATRAPADETLMMFKLLSNEEFFTAVRDTIADIIESLDDAAADAIAESFETNILGPIFHWALETILVGNEELTVCNYFTGDSYDLYVVKDEQGAIRKVLPPIDYYNCLRYLGRSEWDHFYMQGQDGGSTIMRTKFKGWAQGGAYWRYNCGPETSTGMVLGEYAEDMIKMYTLPETERALTIHKTSVFGIWGEGIWDETRALVSTFPVELSWIDTATENIDGFYMEFPRPGTKVTEHGPELTARSLAGTKFSDIVEEQCTCLNFDKAVVYESSFNEDATDPNRFLFVDPEYTNFYREGYNRLDIVSSSNIAGFFNQAEVSGGDLPYDPDWWSVSIYGDSCYGEAILGESKYITKTEERIITFSDGSTTLKLKPEWEAVFFECSGRKLFTEVQYDQAELLNKCLKGNWVKDGDKWVLESTEGLLPNTLYFADDSDLSADTYLQTYYATVGDNDPKYTSEKYDRIPAPEYDYLNTVVFDKHFMAAVIRGMDPATVGMAIVEKAKEFIENLGGGGGQPDIEAADVSYENNNSPLRATNVQAAIDELAAGGGGGSTASAQPTRVIYIDTNLTTANDDIPGKAYGTFARAASYMEGVEGPFYVELPAGIFDEAIDTPLGQSWIIHGNNTQLNQNVTLRGGILLENCKTFQGDSWELYNGACIQNCTLRGQALNLYTSGGPKGVTIKDCSFSATVFIHTTSPITFINCNFAGGLCSSSSLAESPNITLENCKAYFHDTNPRCNVTATSTDFTSAGTHSYVNDLTASNCSFTATTAHTTSLTNCLVENSLYTYLLSAVNCTFGNSASGTGCSISTSSYAADIYNCTFFNSIDISAAYTLNNCTFILPTTSTSTIRIQGTAKITGCVVRPNSYYGSTTLRLYQSTSGATNLTLDNCCFDRCSVILAQAYSNQGTVTIADCGTINKLDVTGMGDMTLNLHNTTVTTGVGHIAYLNCVGTAWYCFGDSSVPSASGDADDLILNGASGAQFNNVNSFVKDVSGMSTCRLIGVGGTTYLVGVDGTYIRQHDYRPKRYKYSTDQTLPVTTMTDSSSGAKFIGILMYEPIGTATVDNYVWMPYSETAIS